MILNYVKCNLMKTVIHFVTDLLVFPFVTKHNKY